MSALVGALGLAACTGDPGPAGPQGAAGNSGTNGTNGTNGTDGIDGTNGKSCTVVDTSSTTKTINCEDGTSVVVRNGANGTNGNDGTSCSVTDNGDGTKTIRCTDGTSVVVQDGRNAAAVVSLAAEMPKTLTITIDGVSLGASSTVDFTVRDGIGRGAVGLRVGNTGGQLRFNVAKLVPGTATAPSSWKAYIDRAATSGAVTVTQPTYERTGTLIDRGDGSYRYTFVNDLTAQTDAVTGAAIPFEPTLTHRLGIQMSGTISGVTVPPYNAIHDFVPAGGVVTQVHEVVATESCNECHGQLVAHGSRYEIKYCVTCHNPDLFDPSPEAQGNVNVGGSGDMASMVHGIHSAGFRQAQTGPEYFFGGRGWAEVTYPQGLESCRKCHDGANPATPQGDNWKNFPSARACGGCHAFANFTTGANHVGGTVATCAVCHTPAMIEGYHQSLNNTPHNPGVPAPLSEFVYNIVGVTVNGSNQAVIEFSITRDGVPMDLTTLPADLTGGPSFLVAYALPQDGEDAPDFYNNLGKAAAQPASVTLANLRNGQQGTIVAATTAGNYIATLTVPAAAFPVGATLRAVALQGYFSQTAVVGTNPSASYGRHAISAVRAVTGDRVRPAVVGNQKCANCHEWFEAHGGNRVYDTAVCVMCHNPNLSTSGRSSSLANLDSTNAAALNAAGYATTLATDPLGWPEVSNNFKDMIHSIHGSDKRTTPFRFVRNRGSSGVFYYDLSEVTFPGRVNRCVTCHEAGTYETELLRGQLPSTQITTNGTILTTADVTTSRGSLPNATDLVTTPVAAACSACHDRGIAVEHMQLMGARVNMPRSMASGFVETCDLCHGAGRVSDVAVMHEQ